MIYESLNDHLSDVGRFDEWWNAVRSRDADQLVKILLELGYDYPQPYVDNALEWGITPNPGALL
jgi:hypothetical protein